MPISSETRAMVLLAAQVCEEKKATDTRILELDAVDAGFTDFFLITSGNNTRQTGAIADDIELRLKREFGVYAKSVEGRRQGEWILLDYIDFVVHIFTEQTREYYDIERLRKSARPVETAELAAALRQKTEAVRNNTPRSKALAKTSPEGRALAARDATLAQQTKATPPAKKSAKKSAAKKALVKSPARKAALAKAPAKKAPAKKAAAKKAPAKKAPAKKAPAKKAPEKKAPAKKAPAKKASEKKAPAKKASAKKAPANKSTTIALPAKKASRGSVEDTSRKALPAGTPAKTVKRLPAPKK